MIASLTGRHEFLVNQREIKKAKLADIRRLKTIILHKSDEIMQYLSEAMGIAKRHQLDFTPEDIMLMKQVEGKYLKEQKLALQHLLPQIKSQVYHIDSQVGAVYSLFKRQLAEANELRDYLLNYESRSSPRKAKKSSSLLTEVQEDEDHGGDHSRQNS